MQARSGAEGRWPCAHSPIARRAEALTTDERVRLWRPATRVRPGRLRASTADTSAGLASRGSDGISLRRRPPVALGAPSVALGEPLGRLRVQVALLEGDVVLQEIGDPL